MSTTKLYIGLNDKNTKRQEHSNIILRDIIYECLFDFGFNAFTCQLVDGVYEHNDGTIVNENTYVITICTDDNPFEITQYEIETLKRELNQECIMIEKYESIVKFI